LNIRKTPVSVIGLGADPDFFRPGLDADFLRVKYGCREKTVLLTVAELKRRKGVDKTLLAIKALGEKGKNLLYLVVGDGPERPRLERIARENGLENRVIFTGAVPDKDLRFYYALCDIFVLPNREEKNGDVEGFCIVFIEAGACEKPVIGGKSGGATDSVAHGKTGILVDPFNEQAIAEKIAWLVENRDKALEMGKNGRQRILSIFTWPLMTSKTEMVYTEIFSRKKRR
jgi:phosphatidylinositol alpha-1,6-mannosyltransferase